MTRTTRLGFALAGVALALAFAVDHPIARLMAHAGTNAVAIFSFITWFGQGGAILYPTGAIVVIARIAGRLRLMARAAFIFLIVAGAGLANDALKILFGRARPHLWLNGDRSGFHFLRYGAKFASFPSGHTATSVAAAVAFGALFPRRRIVFAAGALLIAISRIVLDQHYLSDVIAGALVGGAVARAILGHARIKPLLAAATSREFGKNSV